MITMYEIITHPNAGQFQTAAMPNGPRNIKIVKAYSTWAVCPTRLRPAVVLNA
jgi:hypothetical protein